MTAGDDLTDADWGGAAMTAGDDLTDADRAGAAKTASDGQASKLIQIFSALCC